MSKRTLTPLAIFSQSNLTGNESDFGSGIDFFDGRWLDWDGQGSANLRLRFLDCPTPPQVGANLQTLRVFVRRSPLSGSNTVTAEFAVQQVGQLVQSFGTFDIVNEVSELREFTFDASLLPDPTGIGLEVVINQTSGGSGNPGNQSSFDVGAAELIYEDGIGNQRLIRHRACDGSCCVAAPRFPLGDGVTVPHQGSDCLHHSPAIGKQFHGCAIIEDASQQPTPGAPTALKGESRDALTMFTETCLNWPQNTPAGDDIGNCCWLWEDDI
jgi:hypothetical protein